jgi:hypothetical protein
MEPKMYQPAKEILRELALKLTVIPVYYINMWHKIYLQALLVRFSGSFKKYAVE